MNSCMIAHASQKEEDAAREEWFATIDVRRQEREEKEIKKKEQEKLVKSLLKEEASNTATGFGASGGICPIKKGRSRRRR